MSQRAGMLLCWMMAAGLQGACGSSVAPGARTAELRADAALQPVIQVSDTVGHRPQIARADDGRFVIVWQESDSAYSYYDNQPSTVRVRLFAADGTPRSGIMPVVEKNILPVDNQQQLAPTVAMDAAGNFVVMWSQFTGLWLQRFDADGVRIGGEILVDLFGAVPAIGMAADGSFVAAWLSAPGQQPLPLGENAALLTLGMRLMAQRFAADGTALGDALLVDSTSPLDSIGADSLLTPPALARNSRGEFALCWGRTLYGNLPVLGTTVDAHVLYLRSYTAEGVARGPRLRANSYSAWSDPYGYVFPAAPLLMDEDGRMTLLWDGYNPAEPDDLGNYDQPNQHLYLRRFEADGSPQAAEISLNDPDKNQYYYYPAAIADGDGGLSLLAVYVSGRAPAERFELQLRHYSYEDGTLAEPRVTFAPERGFYDYTMVMGRDGGIWVAAVDFDGYVIAQQVPPVVEEGN